MKRNKPQICIHTDVKETVFVHTSQGKEKCVMSSFAQIKAKKYSNVQRLKVGGTVKIDGLPYEYLGDGLIGGNTGHRNDLEDKKENI
jgi:hypothetical protein